MSKDKFYQNPKNIAILVLVITVGSIITLLSLNFEVTDLFLFVREESFSEPASAPISAPPTQYSSPPPTSVSVIDNIVNNLEWGNIAFNTPQKARLEEPTTIELFLSPTQSIEELQSSLKSQGQIESAEIRISNQMVANLVGTGFQIEALRPQEQVISSNKKTQWKWEVTPTQEGSQNLELTLSAIINISGQERQLVIETFTKTIEVEVNTGQRVSTFVTGNWQWLWASILVPAAPFVWKWYKNKRGRNSPA